MAQDKLETEKTAKAAAVLGGLNLLATPFYFISTKVGLLASMVINTFAIYQFSEIGKEKRQPANALNAVNNFFGGNNNLQNSAENMVEGGATLFDEMDNNLTKFRNNI